VMAREHAIHVPPSRRPCGRSPAATLPPPERRSAHDFGRLRVLAAGPVAAPAGPQQAACDRSKIDAARHDGQVRTAKALERVAGLGGSPGELYDPTAAWQLRARNLARVIFETDNPDMGRIQEVLGDIRARLANSSLPVQCAAADDEICGTRPGYVVDWRPPIILCPLFFTAGSDEKRAQTMVHEAAHLSRIGDPAAETYSPVFDCDTGSGGMNEADAWAHYVHCLSGQPPEKGVE
jgi:hypothetical protein